MELSNKALAVLLLAALVVSLGGTMISLNRMNSIETVGFAQFDQGIVNLSIASTVSITTEDSYIVNFGACSLNSSRAINISSQGDLDTAEYCLNYQADNITNISVRNNGNVLINVTIATSTCAPGAGNESCAFLNVSSTPQNDNGLFEYTTTSEGRAGYQGGCALPNATWNPFNGTEDYTACTNLNFSAAVGGENSFVTDFRLRIPSGLGVGEQIATLTYTAWG